MTRKWVFVLLGAVVAAVFVIALLASTSSSPNPLIAALRNSANSFPVPTGATKAFPDTTVKSPPSVTKGWRTTDAIDNACSMWRDAYRTWIGSQALGSVTGSDTPGQTCSYTGSKNGHVATLQVSVYGSDPQPDVTLTVSK